MSAFAYYAPAQPDVFHNHDCCPQGARIPMAMREPVVLGIRQCAVCATLDELLRPPRPTGPRGLSPTG